MDEKIRPLVDMINRLGLETYGSCEGHARRTITQSAFPCVAIKLQYSGSFATRWLRFCGMIRIHNENSHESGDVRWAIVPGGGDFIVSLRPADIYERSEVLHKGIVKLVENLEALDSWYYLKGRPKHRMRIPQ